MYEKTEKTFTMQFFYLFFFEINNAKNLNNAVNKGQKWL